MSNDNATLTACREALAAMEQAEAAMTPGLEVSAEADYEAMGERCWAVMQLNPDYDEATCDPDDEWTLVALCPDESDADGIAALRNDAPGSLRFRRDMLALCREWLLSEAVWTAHQFYAEGGGSSGATARSAAAVARHDAALAILAALADAMGVTGGGK